MILAIIQIGFGSYAVVLKALAQSQGVDPLIFSFLRDAGTFPLLFVSSVVIEGYHKPQLKDAPLFFALGLTGMFGNQVLFIYGLYFTSATIASILQPMIPVLTVAFALILRIETFDIKDISHWAKIWGIFSSGGGAVIMIMAGGNLGSSQFLGYLFLLGNTSAMAIYVLLQKRYLYIQENGKDKRLYPPITASAYSYGMGTLLMGLASVPYGIAKPEVFTNLTYQVIYPLAYAILISSSMCYALINVAASLTSATIVTAFWPLQVPVTIFESFFVFGEVPFWTQYVGALFIVFGLVAVCAAKYWQEKQEAKNRLRFSEKSINHNNKITTK